MNALILGTVDFLRDKEVGLALSTNACDEQPDGQPPPVAETPYYAIWEASWSNDATESLDETYGIQICITLKTSHIPVDRLNVNAKRQLRTLAEALRAKIHGYPGNYDCMEKVNAKLNLAVENGFDEPLRFHSAGLIVPQGPDWFWSDAAGDNPPTGLSIVLQFGGARRVQSLQGPVT